MNDTQPIIQMIWERERAASQRYSDGDNTGYLEIYRDDMTYADPFCPRILNGKAEATAYFGTVPKIRIEKAEWSNEHLSLNESGDMAILTYNQQNYIRGKNDGILHTMPLWHCVEIYRLTDGEWKIAHANWSLAQHPAVMKSFQALFAQMGY